MIESLSRGLAEIASEENMAGSWRSGCHKCSRTSWTSDLVSDTPHGAIGLEALDRTSERLLMVGAALFQAGGANGSLPPREIAPSRFGIENLER